MVQPYTCISDGLIRAFQRLSEKIGGRTDKFSQPFSLQKTPFWKKVRIRAEGTNKRHWLEPPMHWFIILQKIRKVALTLSAALSCSAP